MNLVKKYLKNERGLTLIELLAVVVILGIIAAIAIPSIGGLIENSKKDAHIANAQQMVSSVKTMMAGGIEPATAGTYTLEELQDGGYIEKMKDPSKEDYDAANSKVVVTETKATGKASTYTYEVTLISDTTDYISNVNIDSLTRTNVTLP